MNSSRIGITLGDPGGIGPEVVFKAFQKKNYLPEAEYFVIGSKEVYQSLFKSFSGKNKSINFNWIDVKSGCSTIETGHSIESNGKVSFLAFEKAVELARKKDLDAIVTAPISKESWNLAGVKWAGHTDYLHSLYPKAIMSFFSKNLKVALFSHHLPLKTALKRITKGTLEEFFLDLHQFLYELGQKKFHYLVAGLNPHAGESGILGSEEKEEIIPAINAARKKGVPLEGPFPADTVFHMAKSKKDIMVIALYHDQGLIAFKLDAFYTGVNMTLGLPFIRTSPDHGTAFNIAGKNKADCQSMINAIQLASDFCTGSF